MRVYLRIGADSLDEAKLYKTKRAAVAAFEDCARELDRYGQAIDGTLHCATNRDELCEYPDYVLSLGPRGGLRCERA